MYIKLLKQYGRKDIAHEDCYIPGWWETELEACVMRAAGLADGKYWHVELVVLLVYHGMDGKHWHAELVVLLVYHGERHHQHTA